MRQLALLVLACLAALPAAAQLRPVDTAIVITVGPLIDNGDFKTLETSIAYNATGMSVDLIESSGTATVKTDLTLTTASTQDWTHVGNGMYEIEITAAQNDTEGELQVVGVVDGVLPFFSPVYTVVPVAVFNSLNLGSDNLQVDTVQVEGTDATNAINAEADTALADYDPPTNAEMEARTLVAANYFDPSADTVANVTTVAALQGHTPQTADHTASIAAILADTAAVDTASELQTLLMGSAVAPASSTALATAQADLDTLTGADGAILATTQPNYAPATAAALDTVDNFLDTEIAAMLADTDELQTRLGNMIEADGPDWRYTTNALEQAPGGSGGDATAANQTTIINHLTDIKGATWASTDSLENIRNEGVTAQADLDTITGSDGATLATSQPNYAPNTTTPPTVGQIRTEMETAGGSLALILADTAALDTSGELRTLLAGSDTPIATQSAQTTAQSDITSILGDTAELQTRFAAMIEADGGDWRFDANALELAPAGGGGGGDATEANQLTIIDTLDDIKGATFDTATDSLEAIRNRGDAAWGGGGGGDTPVNHDTGGADTYTVQDGDGAGIEDVLVQAYVKSEYDAGTFTLRAQTTTKADGTWESNLMLNDGVQYTLVFYKPGAYGPATATITP